ncbi:MAG: OmcA/MtrC family decaheme c-type cytochrome [Dehalococcoidales bacterium]|nr:OmcA/MtrC family decaheme c-type cytochrome [Dehalococcoidales bacterium]
MKRFLQLAIICLTFAAVFAGCKAGQQGAQGPAGQSGAPGPQGTAGAPAPVTPGAGLKATITRVDVGADRKVTVSYKLTDEAGTPVSRSLLDANSERFSIARLSVDSATQYSSWLSYVVVDVKGVAFKLNGKDTQPALAEAKGVPVTAADTAGEYKEVGPGQYTYTMKTVLPDGFDKTATHRVMYQGTRNARVYLANATLDFVPAGGDVKTTRQVVATENCNKCHDPLVIHGARYDTKLCVVCHTPQNVEPNSGNVLDFKVFVHKIHDAENLPSVKSGKPYFVTNSNHDFSDVALPQDVRNCTTCHSNAPNWKTAPSRAACGSCHDNIDWATGKSAISGRRDHLGGPQKDDTTCKGCHQPDSGQEFDASVVGAHTIPATRRTAPSATFSRPTHCLCLTV